MLYPVERSGIATGETVPASDECASAGLAARGGPKLAAAVSSFRAEPGGSLELDSCGGSRRPAPTSP